MLLKLKALAPALLLACGVLGHSVGYAQSPSDYVGMWEEASGEGAIRAYLCRGSKFSPEKNALCARVIWDNDAVDGAKGREKLKDCNRQIMFLREFKDGAWQNGWGFDVRDHKTWRVAVRLSDDKQKAYVRFYVGNERNGKTETFTRTNNVPTGCKGIKPSRLVIK